MTILCHGDCHVWLGASSLCTCEVAAWDALSDEALFNFEYYSAANNQNYPPSTMMYPFPGSYNPFGPHAPQPTPAAPDVPLQQFKAAQEEGATHLSTDGKTAYDQRQYSIYRCFWDQEEKRFGGWWKFEGELPTDAVLLDKEQL